MQTESKFIDVDGRRVYTESAGDGPVLVLGHAAFLDSRQWDDQWEPFAERHRVVRYDLGGYGRSDPLSEPVSRVKELGSVLDALGIERAALLGCSMSGTAVVDYTLAHPERVIALIPVSTVPSGFEMEGEMPPEVAEMIAAVQANDVARASELQVHIWVDGPHRTPDQVSPEIRRRAAEMNLIAVKNGTLLKFDFQGDPEVGEPAVKRLKNVNVPTLAIAGELDYPENIAGTRYLGENIAGARFMSIPGGAHVPNMDNPGVFNDAVLRFLGARLTRQ